MNNSYRRRRYWLLTIMGVLLITAVASLAFAQQGRPGQSGRPDAPPAQGNGPAKAKNVILLVGDGLGESEITMARNYHLGASGNLAMDSLPMTGDYTTYSVEEEDPAAPNYVADSAATATAFATGEKTSNGRISTTPGTDRDLTTVLELAQREGMKTGNVTTADMTDATPGAISAHVADRGCHGPEDMEGCSQDRKSAGGPGSIAEQQADSQIDVLLGGGRDVYEQEIYSGEDAGDTVAESAERQGYETAYTASEMEKADPDQKLLGLFAEGIQLDPRWEGEPAKRGGSEEAQRCTEDARPSDQPDLEDMTGEAIDRLENDRKGFFLQVESASIDKQEHRSDPCGQIGATVELDNAVGVAQDFAEENPNTQIIVTGDHGHAAQIIPNEANSYGESSTLRTADEKDMTVNYATSKYRDEDGEPIEGGGFHEHTGTEIRVAAQGPRAQEVSGLTDQTELKQIMAKSLSIENGGAQSRP